MPTFTVMTVLQGPNGELELKDSRELQSNDPNINNIGFIDPFLEIFDGRFPTLIDDSITLKSNTPSNVGDNNQLVSDINEIARIENITSADVVDQLRFYIFKHTFMLDPRIKKWFVATTIDVQGNTRMASIVAVGLVNSANILNLATSLDFRRKGFARKMMDIAEDEICSERRVVSLRATQSLFEGFYSKRGYTLGIESPPGGESLYIKDCPDSDEEEDDENMENE